MSLVERCRHPHVFGRFCHINILVKQFWRTLSFPPASEFPAIDVSLVSPQGERVLLCPRPLWHDTCSLLSYLAHICTPAWLAESFAVNLPRPRTREAMIDTDEYTGLRSYILHFLMRGSHALAVPDA
jgi:hypothetical protein